MLEYIKRQYNEGNFLLLIIIILCLFAIFPFLYLIQYNITGASDDLAHGFYLIDKSYIDGILTWYNNGYNGRYANAVIMQIPERPFLNLNFGKVFPAVLLLFMSTSLFYLLNSVNGKINWKNNLLYTLLILTFFLSFTPSIHQFFWFSGATVYIFPTICYFFLLGLLIGHFNKKYGILKIIISALLLFFVIGSHENWMVIGLITVLLFVVNTFLKKERLKPSSYFILIWTLLLVSFVLFAPGTTQRMAGESTKSSNADIWGSFCYALIYSGTYIKEWFLNIGVLITLAGIAISPQKQSLNKQYFKSFSNIFLFLVAFIFIYSSFFILLYSLGISREIRLRGVLPGFFISSLIIFYLIKELNLKLKTKKFFNKITKTTSYIVITIGLFIGISSSSNIHNAYDDILSGNAKEASEQILWMKKYIESSSEKELRLPQVNTKTKSLLLFFVPYSSDTWYSWAVDKYYKKSITLDKSISFDEFKFYNDTTGSENYVKLCEKKKYSYSYKFSLNNISKSNKETIVVEAKIGNHNLISKDNKCMLVFDCAPFWKGYYIKDIIQKSGYIQINQIIPKIDNPEQDILKVYFFNPSNDTIIIEKMNAKIL